MKINLEFKCGASNCLQKLTLKKTAVKAPKEDCPTRAPGAERPFFWSKKTSEGFITTRGFSCILKIRDFPLVLFICELNYICSSALKSPTQTQTSYPRLENLK